MKNKKLWLGMLVLVFGFVFSGCDWLFEDKGYTFEIEIMNSTNRNEYTIKQIDFINGSKPNDPVLRTEMVNLLPNAKSEYYKVSGFTVNASREERRICGVKVFYSNGKIGFGYEGRKNNSKFRATALSITDPPSVSIYSD